MARYVGSRIKESFSNRNSRIFWNMNQEFNRTNSTKKGNPTKKGNQQGIISPFVLEFSGICCDCSRSMEHREKRTFEGIQVVGGEENETLCVVRGINSQGGRDDFWRNRFTSLGFEY
jgi:hypothetical protein